MMEQYEVVYWCINAYILNLNDKLNDRAKKAFSIKRFVFKLLDYTIVLSYILWEKSAGCTVKSIPSTSVS